MEEFRKEDAEKGETFKDKVLALLSEQNVILKERHEELHSANMSTIDELAEETNQIKLIIKHNNQKYELLAPKPEQAVLRASLCWLYGCGLIKYDYNLPIFSGLEEKVMNRYHKLAIEIWERNTHIDWMQQHKKYLKHNGSKGPSFLYGVSSDDKKEIFTAIAEHRVITDAREGGDTPHHIFRDPKKLRSALLDEGRDAELKATLVESIYDQTTATVRTWYPDRKAKRFKERLEENRDKGYFCEGFRWIPGAFGFESAYEQEIWKIWCRAHEEFKEYWINKFGENEERWQPPAPLKE